MKSSTIVSFLFAFLLLNPAVSAGFTVDFSWSMAQRFGIDADGDQIPDAFDTPEKIDPGTFDVTFDACAIAFDPQWRTYPVTYRWVIDETHAGESVDCTFQTALSEGEHSVELTVENSRGEHVSSAPDTILVQDWLIVSMGDSYASGEGNPDILPLTEGSTTYDLSVCGVNTFEQASTTIVGLRTDLSDTLTDLRDNLYTHLDQARDDLAAVHAGLSGVYTALDTWKQRCWPEDIWSYDLGLCKTASTDLISALGSAISGIDPVALVAQGYDAVNAQIELFIKDAVDGLILAEEAVETAHQTAADARSEIDDVRQCLLQLMEDRYLGGRWVNSQCHRSMRSKEARTAYEIELADEHTSVTFVSVACSGATIRNGLLGAYGGVRHPQQIRFNACQDDYAKELPEEDENDLQKLSDFHVQCCEDLGGCRDPQVDEVKNLVGNREIDALLISIGGNDIRFAPIAENCMFSDYCNEDSAVIMNIRDVFVSAYCHPLLTAFPYHPEVGQFLYDMCLLDSTRIPDAGIDVDDTAKDMFQENIGNLAGLYADLDNRIETTLGVIPQHVYLTEYPNAVLDQNGDHCYSTGTAEDVLRMLPGFHTQETQWADETVTVQLNSEVHATAVHGWQIIDGIYDLYSNDNGTGHGYCSSETWFRRIQESLYYETRISESDVPLPEISGTMHPTAEGNNAVALQRMVPRLLQDFYVDGAPRPLSGKPDADIGKGYQLDEGDSITPLNRSYDTLYGLQLDYLWSAPPWLKAEVSDPTQRYPLVRAENDSFGWLALKVTNPAGISSVKAAPVQISNVVPHVALTVPKGKYYAWSEYGFPVSFSDPGPSDTHSLTVDWGDGSPPERHDYVTSPVTLSHTYASAGTFTVQVAVEDDGGGTGTASETVLIHDHPLYVDDDGDGYSEYEGDCDDNERWLRSPGIDEICDHIDNDCNGLIDDGLTNNCGVIYVKHDASESNDGSSWQNAFTSLQDALAAAVSGQHIWVARGTYYPTVGTDRTVSFAIPDAVQVYGGFNGTEDVFEQRDFSIYTTVLSGDIGVAGVNADNSYHVVTQAGPFASNSTRLDGLTITGGNATDAPTSPYGGGMMFRDSPLVVNSVFIDNTALRGGAFYGDAGTIGGSSPRFVNTRFLGNTGKDFGGAGYHERESDPEYINCLFTGNRADYGGALALFDTGSALLKFATFANNTADEEGGGIFIYNDGGYTTSSDVSISASIFWDNGASAAGPEIFVNGGAANVGIDYSAVAKITASIYDPAGDVVLGGHNETSLDIVFQNAAGPDGVNGTIDDDLRLRSNSGGQDDVDPSVVPADFADLDRDANTAEALPFDLDSRPRTVTAADMGAYENGSFDWYVDGSATGGRDGTSWNDAFVFLQNALQKALAGDQIHVAGGIYKPDRGLDQQVGDREATFKIPSGVALYGGYPVGGGYRDPKYHPSVLSGDINAEGESGDNSYHVVNAYHTNAETLIDGFTISDGNASPNYHPANKGGGILVGNGNLTIANLIIRDNKAYHRGGGVWVSTGSPRIYDTIITANQAIEGGGAAFENGVDPLIRWSSLLGNHASSNGGGLYISNSGGRVMNTVFSGNSSTGSGGGMISVNNSSFDLVNCTFSRNETTSGGALFVDSGSVLSLENSILWGNYATNGPEIALQAATLDVLWTDIEGGADAIYQSSPISYSHQNTYDMNPLFANAAGNDLKAGTADDNLHVGQLSLAIDAGNPASTYINEPGVPTGANGGRINLGAYGNTSEAQTTRLSGGLTLYVNSEAAGKETGTSWSGAFTSLQYALKSSMEGDRIFVAEGVYTPDAGPNIEPGDRLASFTLRDGVEVLGGFRSGDVFEDRNPQEKETVLSGDLNSDDGDGFTNYEENSQHVVVGSGTGSSTLLNGFTIRSGNATSSASYPANGGGGMYNEGGSPTVSECVFELNQATSRGGGGMLNHGESSPAISHSVFRNNRGGLGAALYSAYDSNSPIANTLFIDNGGSSGGAIFLAYSSNVSIQNCTFHNNLALTKGGALDVFASNPLISNSIFWENAAPSGQGHEFGLNGATLTISYSSVDGGQADIVSENSTINWNAGNISGLPPLFADASCHLDANSPCVDGGNPLDPYANEPGPNGSRINMGAYGNTAEAAQTDIDRDDDTISNSIEDLSCSDPDDADSDDDGIPDQLEDLNRNGVQDEGETNPCSADSDGDGILDGTEAGYTVSGPYTDPATFQPDLDATSTTDPLSADSDGDGLTDGQEDANANGRWDTGETASTVMSGDYDTDAAVSLTDLILVLKASAGEAVASPDFNVMADTDGNRKADIGDALFIIQKSTLP